MGMSTRSLSIVILNQLWFAEELETRGHRVVTIGWDEERFHLVPSSVRAPIQQVLAKLPKSFQPDLLIYHDDSRPYGFTGLEELDFSLILFSVDAHHHHAWHVHFSQLFDQVLVAQKSYVPHFERVHPNVSWFPLWAPLDLKPEPTKTFDATFRGNLDPKLHPERAAFFKKLAARVPVDAVGGPFEEVYTRSRIVVNEIVKDDLNFRVFESIIAGALLVTPEESSGLADLFVPGEELITYRRGDVEDAAQKIQYYLEHEAERARIATKGREKVLQLHTRMHRAIDLERHLLQLRPRPNKQRLLGAALTYLTTAEICRKNNTPLVADFLILAGDYLVKSAKARETCDQSFLGGVSRCKCYLEREGLFDNATKFLAQIFDCYSEDSIIGLTYLDSLLQIKQFDLAKTIAEQISSSPEELLARAPEVMDQIRKQIIEER